MIANPPYSPAYQDAGVGEPMDDVCLIEALRRGDEAAFSQLLDGYYPAMMRLALLYVQSRAVAEDVVQETWLSLLQGLACFEFRSSLRTWIFRILTNCAKTRGQREGRYVPFAALSCSYAACAGPAVDMDRCGVDDHQWVSAPRSWAGTPEERALSHETHAYVQRVIAALPLSQRAVITLRDMGGWTADEVCPALAITAANQRVLLHRARSTVRRALERYFDQR